MLLTCPKMQVLLSVAHECGSKLDCFIPEFVFKILGCMRNSVQISEVNVLYKINDVSKRDRKHTWTKTFMEPQNTQGTKPAPHS